MLLELENSSAMTVTTISGEASASSSGNQTVPLSVTTKKKRNLPGMPDPESEVIALSPKTLMATNRFVCEICNKGFQRDQNLQLHRRGHNLPWKLRQRTSKDIRKRVYVCPEPSCVHHDPSRALGDLTGIKKHFCRKHGEKKWKCDKCSKKYAVQSDWKAHLKTCGTREYRCDCGTLFSRRDSFTTHRAFCDALAEESTKAQTVTNSTSAEQMLNVASSSPQSTVFSAVLPIQNSELPENPTGILHQNLPVTCVNGSSSSNNYSMFANLFSSSAMAENLRSQNCSLSDLICAMARSERPTSLASASATEPVSLCLSSNNGSSSAFFATQDHRQFAPQPQPQPQPQPAMSATALLQKAAQIGAATNSSLLRGFGMSVSSSSSGLQQWNRQIENEQPVPGLGIGDGGAGSTELMMGSSSLFDPKPTTLDFLGLGMGGGAPKGGLSALLSSFGGGNLSGNTWEGPNERKCKGSSLHVLPQ